MKCVHKLMLGSEHITNLPLNREAVKLQNVNDDTEEGHLKKKKKDDKALLFFSKEMWLEPLLSITSECL